MLVVRFKLKNSGPSFTTVSILQSSLVKASKKFHLNNLPQTQFLLWSSWRSDEHSQPLRNGLDILITMAQWSLWKERNKRCFDFHAYLPTFVAKQIAKLFFILD